MSSLNNTGAWFWSNSCIKEIADAVKKQKEHSLRAWKPRDPTTPSAMRLSELRAEERAAMWRQDREALEEIRLSIARELAE